MSRTHARILLALFVLVTTFFVAITSSSLKSGFADAPNRGPGDVELYRAEVERIQAGESYYEAAATELRSRGYPTRSLFNWRTPLPVWLIGSMPSVAAAQGLLGLVALVLLVLSFRLLAEQGGVAPALLGVVLLSGALLPIVLSDLFVMSELWSGVLIALSVVCFGLNYRMAGILAGVAAIFFRELAAPYCMLCIGLDLWARRDRETLLWTVGLAAYAAFFGLHASHVLPLISPDDTAHPQGWLRFGAAGFLISTTQMNVYLLLLPQWVTAIYLSCALLGCATWNSPQGQLVALTTVVYAVVFSVMGHDFNQYWGSLTSPLLCLAACRAPQALRELWLMAAKQKIAVAQRFVSAQR